MVVLAGRQLYEDRNYFEWENSAPNQGYETEPASRKMVFSFAYSESG
jgi:hypothetical protein